MLDIIARDSSRYVGNAELERTLPLLVWDYSCEFEAGLAIAAIDSRTGLREVAVRLVDRWVMTEIELFGPIVRAVSRTTAHADVLFPKLFEVADGMLPQLGWDSWHVSTVAAIADLARALRVPLDDPRWHVIDEFLRTNQP